MIRLFTLAVLVAVIGNSAFAQAKSDDSAANNVQQSTAKAVFTVNRDAIFELRRKYLEQSKNELLKQNHGGQQVQHTQTNEAPDAVINKLLSKQAQTDPQLAKRLEETRKKHGIGFSIYAPNAQVQIHRDWAGELLKESSERRAAFDAKRRQALQDHLRQSGWTDEQIKNAGY